MSVSKEEAYLNYKQEIFKQTMPYSYEMTYLEDAQSGLPEGSPSLDVHGKIVYFPDAAVNILNFEGIMQEYIIFVSREGVAENCLERVLLGLGAGADVIYCDEDFTTDSSVDLNDINDKIRKLRTPYRKPEYSPDTIVHFPYVETCFAIRTSFARSVPALAKSAEITDTIRVCDFLLRALERTRNVVHVPYILYHRDLKYLLGTQGAQRATDEDIFGALFSRYEGKGYRLLSEAAIKRRGLNAIPDSCEDRPLLSIIIPSKDNPEVLKECLRSIRLNVGNVSYEVIVVDNGSSESNKAFLEKYISELPKMCGRYLYGVYDFNFSYMCNVGAGAARGDFLLFMNDDVSAVTENFGEKMLKYACHGHVGAVGAKLLYPDNSSIQHIGVFDTFRGPVHKLMLKNDDRVQYGLRNRYVHNVLAVTGACLMVEREKYFKIGGFNDRMKVGYNDVDLCVKLLETGHYNLVDNDCVFIHRESLSRGADAQSDEKAARLSNERALLYELHPWLLEHRDPFYGSMLDEDTIEIKSIVVPDYQKADFRNNSKEYNKLPAKASDKVNMSFDYFGIERAVAEGAEDAYVIEGWGLVLKGDNSAYKKYVVLIPCSGDESEKPMAFTTCPKYRPDVAKVFPDAKNVYMAGFTCRIPFSSLDSTKSYRIGVMMKKITGIKSYKLTLEDAVYEPGRGITKDSPVL